MQLIEQRILAAEYKLQTKSTFESASVEMHWGIAPDHFPFLRHLTIFGPLNSKPASQPEAQEKAARPPTSLDSTETRGELTLLGRGISPHSTLSQTGKGALQLPLGRQNNSEEPISEFPFEQESKTRVLNFVSFVLTIKPRRIGISGQLMLLTTTSTECSCLAGVWHENMPESSA
uniref:Uncharacterized protein n=1 Tax=Glossina pallidipes TaxID=7398 RepID=A0A1A9Z419_GLOPL